MGNQIIKKDKFPKVNFIGNKEKIAEWICDYLPKDVDTIFDAFSGGGSVSYFAKRKGLTVISNDILKINHLISKSLIENDIETLNEKDVALIFKGKPLKGFMYKNYSNKMFFPEECMELDLYRKNIEKLGSEYKKALALVLMRRAMIRKMPYSRFNLDWEKIKQLRDEEYSYSKYKRRRAYHNKNFQEHFIENIEEYNSSVFKNGKKHKSFNDDIFNLLGKVKADVVYLDPPYTGTMNNYFGFYGVIDEYVLSKKQEPFENNFIKKDQSLILFDKLFKSLKSYKYWMLSYNNNSYPNKNELLNLIKKYRTNINVIEKKHNYKITGKKHKDSNKEYLFIIKK